MLQSSKRQTLRKPERLNSQKIISKLFDRKSKDTQSFLVFPFRVVVLQEEPQELAYPEILISVSKRTFKKAVDRNRVKRLTKEAYRTQKSTFPQKTYLAFLFVGKKMPQYSEIEKSISLILHKLSVSASN